ncbi:MAG: DUF1624 domain-containing protein [Lacibacter sp.]
MQQPLSASRRIASIDLLRGLVMIIMALDHTRDFFHTAAFTDDPLNLATTTPLLYFTRWITHFCAPTFVFLSGMSAWLQQQRKTTKELSWFLITRGLWLIIVELFIVSLGITGDITYSIFILQTIWSIGISMVLLGFVIHLPFKLILLIGAVIVLGHNSLDFAEAARKGSVPVWWNFLHVPGIFPIGGDRFIGVFYPFLPWTGLMIVGYCFGKYYTMQNEKERNKKLVWISLSLLFTFIVLRFLNIYGDPIIWTKQDTTIKTLYAFMNVQKYPPSLLYMCATIGGALLFLSCIKSTTNKLSKIIIVYGRVPFFYYILHFYLLNLIHIVLYLGRGHTIAEGMKGLPNLPIKFTVPGEGYSLGIVYLIWIAVVIALYPLCKWYDGYKTNHKEKKWLSYL